MHKIDEQKLKQERLEKERVEKLEDQRNNYLKSLCDNTNFQIFVLDYISERINKFESISDLTLEQLLKMTDDKKTENIISRKAGASALRDLLNYLQSKK